MAKPPNILTRVQVDKGPPLGVEPAVIGKPIQAVLAVTDFEVTLEREVVFDRSDNSQYDTVLDIVTKPYRWRCTSIGDWDGVASWIRAEMLGKVTMKFAGCTAGGDEVTLELRHAVVETMDCRNSWGELGTLSMSGMAIQCEVAVGGAGAIGQLLEGDLIVQRDNMSQNEQRKADGSNHWSDAPYKGAW
jgi:hypothetical protein